MSARRFPVLARHAGVWDGDYRHIGPDGALIERVRMRCRVEVPAEGTVAFRLTTRGWHEDGRVADAVFEGRDGDGVLLFDDGRIHGWLRELDDETVYMRFGFTAAPDCHVCEMIQVAPDGLSRARTWHHFRDHQLVKLTLTREVRVADDPAAVLLEPPRVPWDL